MTAPAADRVRASRLRRRAELSPEDRAWLDSYERDHPSVRVRRSPPAPERAHHPAASPPAAAPYQGASLPPAAPDGAPAPAPAYPASAAAPAPAAEPTAWRTIDFGAPQTAAAIVPVEACKIPDCPACRAQKGAGMTCVATGERVYPPMSEEGAKAMAAMVLGVVAVVVRVGRRIATGTESPVVAPTAAEVAQMGRALREVTYRRASYMGAGDDLFALAWAVGAFSLRAARA